MSEQPPDPKKKSESPDDAALRAAALDPERFKDIVDVEEVKKGSSTGPMPEPDMTPNPERTGETNPLEKAVVAAAIPAEALAAAASVEEHGVDFNPFEPAGTEKAADIDSEATVPPVPPVSAGAEVDQEPIPAPAPAPEPPPVKEEKAPTRGVMPTDFVKKDDGFDPNYISPNSAEAMYADKMRAEQERKVAEAKMTADHAEALAENEQHDTEASKTPQEEMKITSPEELKRAVELKKANNLRMQKAVEAQKAAREARAAQAEAAVAVAETPPAPTPEVPAGEEGSAVDFFARKALGNEFVDVASMPKMTANPDNAPDYIKNKTEGTRSELVQRLREAVWKVVGGVREGAGKMVEKVSEGYTKSKEFLNNRIKEIDAQAKEKGETRYELLFANLGERYNKLPTWQKIALGSSLAVGLGFTSSAVAGIYGAALVGTRVAALAGSFKNNTENLGKVHKGETKGGWIDSRLNKWLGDSSSERNLKNAAMGKALVTSLGMTAALGTGAKLLSDYNVAERVGSWIGEHVYNLTHADAGVEAVGAGVSESLPTPGATILEQSSDEVSAGVESAAGVTPGTPVLGRPEGTSTSIFEQSSDEVSGQAEPVTAGSPSPAEGTTPGGGAPPAAAPAAEAIAPNRAEVPLVLEKATPGKGYEYMAKRMWEQLQTQNLNADNYDKDSDIYKLLKADAKSINDVVHDIAKEHEYYKPDGTSVVVRPEDVLTIGKNGQVLLMTPENIFDKAPTGELTTPAYHPGTATPTELLPLEREVMPAPRPPLETFNDKTVLLDDYGNPIPATNVYTPSYEGASAPIEASSTVTDTDSVTASEDISTQPPTEVVDKSFVMNKFDLQVRTAEPHIYADPTAEHLFVYGGSPTERADAIFKYLTEGNPDKIVYGADANGANRIPYSLDPDGKLTAGLPVENPGFLSKLFGGSQWMKAPGPDEFKQLIK